MKAKQIERAELEKQLTRGARRALEVLAPSKLLTSPNQREKKVDHGELRWIDGQRVVLLHGTPEEIGTAHGKLLRQEANRCIDSVMYAFGTVQTVVTGRWFRDDLNAAYARLEKFIPDRHKAETHAMAVSLELDPESGSSRKRVFRRCSIALALHFSAKRQGRQTLPRPSARLYDNHRLAGRSHHVHRRSRRHDPLRQRRLCRLHRSVSGMNAEMISLGEMGGRGERRLGWRAHGDSHATRSRGV